MKRLTILFCLLALGFFCFPGSLSGQDYVLANARERSNKLPFKLINNLMIVPVEVNGVELSFIMDSGVSKPILFNLYDQDSIELRDVTQISIKGLGEGKPIEALSSLGNTFRIGSLTNTDQQLYVVLDKDMNFSSSLGVPIHGIIGYDIFKDYVVEINYNRTFIRFHHPDYYQPKTNSKAVSLPLEIENFKAYIKGGVVLQGQEEIPVKLLMDTGSSDAIWLFSKEEEGLWVPEKNYEDYLGKGLSGNIFGKRTRIEQVRIGDFVLKDAKAAFPDIGSFQALLNIGDRDGSLGGEVLKRFNMVIDYPGQQITLSKNALFNEPFQFNLAGIELEHAGVRYVAERITNVSGVVRKDDSAFGNVQIMLGDQTRVSLVPEIVVSAIRAGSPAEEVGLREGDVILAVNGKPVHRYQLQEVMGLINSKKGKRVRLLIERYNKDLLFSFVVDDLFKE